MSLGYSSFSASSVTFEIAGGMEIHDLQLDLGSYDLIIFTSPQVDFTTLVEEDLGMWTLVDENAYDAIYVDNYVIFYSDQITMAFVPEPSAIWLPLVALLGVCAYRMRRLSSTKHT